MNTILPPSRDAELRRDALAALRTLDGTQTADTLDLTVARRRLGRGKGWAVRLMLGAGESGAGGAILREWRRPTEADAERACLLVLRAISDRPGFGGIVETSGEDRTITGDMLGDWEGL